MDEGGVIVICWETIRMGRTCRYDLQLHPYGIPTSYYGHAIASLSPFNMLV